MVETVAIGIPPSLGELSAAGPIALFLDFDGTLVDLAATPDSIVVPTGLAKGLEALAERLGGRLALVSGRSNQDIEGHIGPPGVARAGSHGIDRLHAGGMPIGGRPDRLPQAVEEEVRNFVRDHPRMTYEEKTHGAALHFRQDPQLGNLALEFAERLAEAHGLCVKLGKCIVELVHEGADKGGAVRAFMQEEPFSGATPVFVGDDLTDEDGMRAASELGGFGIIVGERTDTLARFRLDSPAQVREWLYL